MLDSIKISVIIPCYNASKYLERTFRALERQTYQSFEVIIINDGSTDDTLSIAKELISHKNNYSIYSFENEGLSEARNRGIAKAIGEYIYFLDADDYFLPTMFEDMVKMIELNENPDVVKCGYKWMFEDIKYDQIDNFKYNSLPIRTFKQDELIDKFVKPIIGLSDEDVYLYYKTHEWVWHEEGFPVWIYFYKRTFIEKYKLRFVKGLKMVEDRIFNLMVMAYAKEVVDTPNTYYFYITKGDGLLSTIYKNPRGLFKDKLAALEQRDLIRELYINKFNIDLWHSYRGSNVMSSLQLALELSKLQYKEGKSLYLKYINHKSIQTSLNDFNSTGAPLKMKIPIEFLKHNNGSLLYSMVWVLRRCRFKFHV